MAIHFRASCDFENYNAVNFELEARATLTGFTDGPGALFYHSGYPALAWRDATEWNLIPKVAVAGINDGMVVSSSGGLIENVFALVGDVYGTADYATQWTTALAFSLTGKATGSANINAGAPVAMTVTALSVAPGDIALPDGEFLRGNGSGVAAATPKASIPLSGFGSPTTAVSFGSQRIINLADPTLPQDAATRAWVLGQISGVAPKSPVRVATAAALPAFTFLSNVITETGNGALTIDGVVMANGDRVLVKDETGGNKPYNGVYTVTDAGSAGTPFILTRATDADTDAEVNTGDEYFVSEGTANAATKWALQTPEPITLNTTDLEFVQTGGSNAYVAGSGIVFDGTTIHFGAATYTQYTFPYASDSTTVGFTNAPDPYNCLRADGSGVPGFGQLDISRSAAVTGTLNVTNGGTGLATIAAGAILYASASNVLAALAGAVTGNVLLSGGVAAAPTWGKVNLTSHVSGTLPVGNGGTGLGTITAKAVLYGNGTSAVQSASGSPGQLLIPNSDSTPTFVTMSGDATISDSGVLTIGAGAVGHTKIADVDDDTVLGRIGLGVGGPPVEVSLSTLATAVQKTVTLSGDVTGAGLPGTTIATTVAAINFGTVSITGTLAVSKGGTGRSVANVFPNVAGNIAQIRKVTLSAGSASYGSTHPWGNTKIAAMIVDSTGQQVFADVSFTTTNWSVTFGGPTSVDHYLILVGTDQA